MLSSLLYNDTVTVQTEQPNNQTSVERKTRESFVQVDLCVRATGKSNINTSMPFLDHMLEQVARHGMLDLTIQAEGDLEVDLHHTVEDIGIVLGQAVAKVVGDKRGLYRYGHAYVPLDEALSRVVIDFSGRPGLTFNCQFTRSQVGQFDTDLFHEFFQGFVNHAMVTLHVDNIRGTNSHHQAETIFKAFGRALRVALTIDAETQGSVPSTKGVL